MTKDHSNSDLQRPFPGPDVASSGLDISTETSRFFASNPLQTAHSPDSSYQVPDTMMVKTGAESGMNRFCQESFISPEATQMGAQALLSAFDDSGLWLASLVQPQHLVAELRQACSSLTRVVVIQWTRQGETQKMVRLAEALLEAQPPVLTHESGQIMALLASLLGVLRPNQAPRWLAACRPLLKDSVDPHLLTEASKWVGVGQFLAALPQEDRLFWNRRLRHPEDDWEWDGFVELDALRRLSAHLPAEHEYLPMFQATLPPCWWELWRERSLSASASKPQKRSVAPAFIFGWVTGIACVLLAGWFSLGLPVPKGWTLGGSSAPQFSFYAVDSSAPSPQKNSRRDAGKKPVPEKVSPHWQARLDAAAEIAAEFPDLDRVHSLVKASSPREASNHIQGKTMIAPQGTKAHRALLRWLMLDPPADPEVREMATKAAVRLLSSSEMYNTLQLCVYADSPNLKEARECASLLLALGADGLNETQKTALAAVSASIEKEP
ncbi:MAG: hypothetical protein OJI67_16260 [Prosthecobacter sp.]|nr:hypothetical protein [Prosthecobacter sp.]